MSNINSKKITFTLTIEELTERPLSAEDYVYKKFLEQGIDCYHTHIIKDLNGLKLYGGRGIPDLVVFDKDKKIVKYVEVKSSSDKLSMEQLEFIYNNSEIPIEVYWLKLVPNRNLELSYRRNKNLGPMGYKFDFKESDT